MAQRLSTVAAFFFIALLACAALVSFSDWTSGLQNLGWSYGGTIATKWNKASTNETTSDSQAGGNASVSRSRAQSDRNASISVTNSNTQSTATGNVSISVGTPPYLPTPGNRYHSWGQEGIDFREVLRYINYTHIDAANRSASSPWRHRSMQRYQPIPGYIFVTNNTPTIWFPNEIIHRINRGRGRGAGDRLQAMLPYFQKALDYQLFQFRERFQPLVSVLTQAGSLPLIFSLEDYRGCQGPHPKNTSVSIERDSINVPLFTLSRSLGCNYTFPIPTYKTFQYMQQGQSSNYTNIWQDRMDNWTKVYPWREKHAKVFWLGACNGLFRKEFVVTAFRKNSEYVDIKTSHPCGQEAKLLRLQGQRLPEESSMNFKAVFDIDGNSWSERFPRLLCYNSAVVRVQVEEDYDEYFMVDLVPGVHYIPATMKNFTEVAHDIMQPENDEMLQNIVKNANLWCRNHMTEEHLNLDFLSVLNGYVEMLNARDPGWVHEWERHASAYAYHVSNVSFRAAVPAGFTYDYFDLSHTSKWNLADYTLSSSPYTGHSYDAKR